MSCDVCMILSTWKYDKNIIVLVSHYFPQISSPSIVLQLRSEFERVCVCVCLHGCILVELALNWCAPRPQHTNKYLEVAAEICYHHYKLGSEQIVRYSPWMQLPSFSHSLLLYSGPIDVQLLLKSNNVRNRINIKSVCKHENFTNKRVCFFFLLLCARVFRTLSLSLFLPEAWLCMRAIKGHCRIWRLNRPKF